MKQKCYRIVAIGVVLCLATAASVLAGVRELRITEIDPDIDRVEVTNTGLAYTAVANHPFCHRFIYGSVIPITTGFTAGQVRLFNCAFLNDTDTDLWIYQNLNFASTLSIIHGVKYGPAPNIGRTGTAVAANLWPSTTSFAPAT